MSCKNSPNENLFTYKKVKYKAMAVRDAECWGCVFKGKGCAGLRGNGSIPECWHMARKDNMNVIFVVV